MGDWQPIETAPRDGTWIIVTSTHNPYYRAAVQWQYGAWIDVSEQDHDKLMARAATHWQPFPQPPVTP